jgi:hypothetical protein
MGARLEKASCAPAMKSSLANTKQARGDLLGLPRRIEIFHYFFLESSFCLERSF